MAEKSLPLTELTKKNQKWALEHKYQQAFEKLKEKLFKAPCWDTLTQAKSW